MKKNGSRGCPVSRRKGCGKVGRGGILGMIWDDGTGERIGGRIEDCHDFFGA